MPVHNGERYLAEALASIHAQGHSPLEIVVVDDGSTDGSAAIAARDKAVRLIRNARSAGAAVARNQALAAAKGTLVAFLDCDDLWPHDKLARQRARLAADPAVDAVFGTIAMVGEDNRVLRQPKDGVPFITVQLGTMLARRSAFDRIGRLDERHTVAEDLDWTLRLREAGIPFAVLDAVTLIYRRHRDNITRDLAQVRNHTLDVLRDSLARRRAARRRGDLPAWSSFVEPSR
jgi:glycosyltransferase involved in cell wall biosynthesis